EAIEHLLGSWVQQRIRPFDGCAQRLLPLHRRATASRQEAKSLVEPFRDVIRIHHGNARRGEFNGQGHTIEATADFRDYRRVSGLERECGLHRASAFSEQLYSVTTREIVDRLARCGHGKRAQGPNLLARKPEPLSARRKYKDVRAVPHDGLDQTSDAL